MWITIVQQNRHNVQFNAHLCTMENQSESTSRQRIKVSVPYADAIELQSFCKRHPVYGITIRILESDKDENYANIEMLFRRETKSAANQSIVHFFLGYAREVYFKINTKIIG